MIHIIDQDLYPLKLPSGLGLEGAGIIKEVGSDVKNLKVGDKVAYAQYLLVLIQHIEILKLKVC